jgi:hypothetical protein
MLPRWITSRPGLLAAQSSGPSTVPLATAPAVLSSSAAAPGWTDTPTPVERRKTPAQGAVTSVLLAASPLLAGVGSDYFEDCNQAPELRWEPVMLGGGVAPRAADPGQAQRPWEMAAELVA